MATIEQVEKLLQYADVSYEEARDALDACGGSLLDAIVLLERQGKIISRGGAKGDSVMVLPGNAQEHKSYSNPGGESFIDMIRRFCKWIGESFDRLCEYIDERVNRHESRSNNAKDKQETDETQRSGESEKL